MSQLPDETIFAVAKAIRDAVHPTQAAIIGPYETSELQARAALEAFNRTYNNV